MTETTKRRVERLERRNQGAWRVDLSGLSAEQRVRFRRILEDLIAGRITLSEGLAQIPLIIGADGAVGVDESQTLTRPNTPEPSLDDDRRRLRLGSRHPHRICACVDRRSAFASPSRIPYTPEKEVEQERR